MCVIVFNNSVLNVVSQIDVGYFDKNMFVLLLDRLSERFFFSFFFCISP